MNFSKRITIKEVAKIAGVSTQTVSRVINDRPDVSSETRERIQQVMSDLDYHPSLLARSLIQQRSYTLGIVTAGLKYIGPSRTLNGMTSVAQELNYALLLEEWSLSDTKNMRPFLQKLVSRDVDGIVWGVPEIGDNHAWIDETLEPLTVPIVFLTMRARQGIAGISVDNYAGGRLATRHLLEQGCCHIGHISGPLEWWEAQERYRAWKDSLQEAGVEVADSHWQEGDWSFSGGEMAFESLMQSYPQMDAVFVANDQMALAVMRVATHRGIRIPGDLALVGFDNLTEADYHSLTTINYDHFELGRRAIQEAVAQIEAFYQNEKLKSQSIVLSPNLVLRESSAKNKSQKSIC